MTDMRERIIADAGHRVGSYRWVIVGLLFLATVINYVDRQMLGVLKPLISRDMGWSEVDYANVVFWFQTAYAIGYLGFGKFVDIVGARLGYAAAFLLWTLAHMAHGGVHSLMQFAVARFGLGIGESGNFPAGIKAVTEWFPARERAFAIGLFNAGSNIGAIVTPLVVPWLVVMYAGDWRPAFVITGGVSLIWLVAWLAIYRRPAEHRRVSPAELAHIQQDPVDPVASIPWSRVVRVRETWAFALGKFFMDPIWWFYLFWLPGYLGDHYKLDLKSFGPPLVAIYLLSDIGSVAGGWLSGRLIAAGRTPNVARKTTMLVACLLISPVLFVQSVDNLWLAVLIIGLATAGHQAFSANLLTLPSDLFPRGAVGSVIGIGGTMGAVGGMLFSVYIGQVLGFFAKMPDGSPNYAPIFFVAATAYFVSLASIHLLSPRLERARL